MWSESVALNSRSYLLHSVFSFVSLQALEFQPEDKLCLVARSRCHLRLGDATEALKDAEESLKEDQKYHKVSIAS